MNYSDYIVREINYKEWNSFIPGSIYTSLNQSWEYGEGKVHAEDWDAKRLVIEKSNGKPIALIQLLIRSLPLIGAIARVSRGPLIINHSYNIDKVEILDIFLKITKKYKWAMISILPELQYEHALNNKLEAIGLFSRDRVSYGSSLISISGDENKLLMSIDGKWRNLLRKSIKMGVNVSREDVNNHSVSRLISEYNNFKNVKNFSGTSSELLYELSKQLSDNWKFKIFSATLSDSNDVLNTIGKVVVITHGNTTTYLIGYTNNIGRYNNANYLLLWKAIIDAKNEGCQFFDLGGLNQTTTKGVAHFKRGLKGKEYILQGEKLYTNYKIISITFVWMESLYNKLSKQIKKFKGRVLIT